ncbi:MAG: deoxyribonuclease IV [Acidobacteriota bacterium]
MRAGLHTSIAGSLEGSALEAARLGANTFQIFSSSPRQWKASIPSVPAIAAMRRAREKHDLFPLVIHDNYLINLAAAQEEIRAKSIVAFRGELERAIAIGAEFLVAHPGNYKGQTVEAGIFQFLNGVAQAADGLDHKSVTLLIENTAGSGAQLGSKLEELHVMREFAPKLTELKIGFCLDTCHLLAAGFDIAQQKGLDETLKEVDRLLGIENVRVIHTNDSKGALGSHLDRHQNIGEGAIGLEGFRRIVNHKLLRDKPFILETPVDKPGDDRRNLDTLKALHVTRP